LRAHGHVDEQRGSSAGGHNALNSSVRVCARNEWTRNTTDGDDRSQTKRRSLQSQDGAATAGACTRKNQRTIIVVAKQHMKLTLINEKECKFAYH
jgi:hypothetical protein